MFLDSTTRKLSIVLTSAKTTNDMAVSVDYVDLGISTTTPGLQLCATNGITAVDMLLAPALSVVRKVNGITVYNRDTAAKTVQINLYDGATVYPIIDITLAVDDTLGYTDAEGWYTIDSAGSRKVVFSSAWYLSKPGGAVTVGLDHCDYTTVQAALNANPIANLLVLVYPGTYTDTINFTANGQCIIGMGTARQQVITQASTSVCNIGAFTNCRLNNFTLQVTAAASAVSCVTASTGTAELYSCNLLLTNLSVTAASQPSLISTTGAANIYCEDGEWTYTNNVSDGTGITAIKAAIVLGAGSLVTTELIELTINGAGQSLAISTSYSSSTGTFTAEDCFIAITDAASSNVVGFNSLGSGTTNHLVYNQVTLTGGAAANVIGVWLLGTATVTSEFNHYISQGGLNNYVFNIAAGNTIDSRGDKWDAAQQYTGAGNIYIAGFSNRGTVMYQNAAVALSSIATAAGTTTLTIDSPYYIVFTGTTTQTCVLPNATTLPRAGWAYQIHNNSTGAVTVQTNGGATLFVMAGGVDAEFVCTSTATAAGVWDVDPNASIYSSNTVFTFPSTSGTVATLNAANAFTNSNTINYTIANTAGTLQQNTLVASMTASASLQWINTNITSNISIAAGQTNSNSYIAFNGNALRNLVATSDGGTLTFLYGLSFNYGHWNTDASTPTTTSCAGIALNPRKRSGTIATLYDVFVAADDGAGTVTTRYGYFQTGTNAPNVFGSAIKVGAATAPAALVDTAAGTSTVAPQKMTAGTNLTSPTAGAKEYDGTAFYSTPVTSNRGVNNVEHFVCLSANYTGANVNTAQQVFNATANGTITLPAATTYEFEALYAISTTGTTSHSIAVLFGGTATITSIAYEADVAENATSFATISNNNKVFAQVATATTLTAAVATATYDVIRLRGTVRINAAGTFIPQFQYSAAPGVAPVIQANSFFRMWAVGSNTVATVGNWS